MVQDRLSALNAAIDYFAADAGNLALANGEISLLDRQVRQTYFTWIRSDPKVLQSYFSISQFVPTYVVKNEFRTVC